MSDKLPTGFKKDQTSPLILYSSASFLLLLFLLVAAPSMHVRNTYFQIQIRMHCYFIAQAWEEEVSL